MKTRNLRTNRAQLLVDDKDAADLDAVREAVHTELGDHATKIISRYQARMRQRRLEEQKRGDKRGAAAAREAAAPKRRPGLSVAPAGRQNGASGTDSATSRKPASVPVAHIRLSAKVRRCCLLLVQNFARRC
eukprot:COSAG04_NODE_485_length_13542_cov_6.498549_9_plen_132_part_00